MVKLATICSVCLLALTAFAQGKAKQEWTLDLTQYGLIKTGCVRYPGHVEFLVDDHLVVNAPVSSDCKSYSGKPPETVITEIDLQGNKLAEVRRADVALTTAGPTGFVSLCTGDRVELLGHNLQPAQSIAVSGQGPSGGWITRAVESRTQMEGSLAFCVPNHTPLFVPLVTSSEKKTFAKKAAASKRKADAG